MPSNVASFLKSRSAQIVTVLLVLQTAGFYGISRTERVPQIRPLSEFPVQVGAWEQLQEGSVEKEVSDILQADDLLTRTYAKAGVGAANLFIAFFKSQRTGKAPHSPKNCLPGAGWAPTDSQIVRVAVPGPAGSIEVNRYIVAKGDQKSVVMYWYQAGSRVIASEYKAKIYLVADSIRYNRSDTALVRIVVPVRDSDTAAAIRIAEAFAAASFPALCTHLPA